MQLVTGATGFVGSRLVRALLAQGDSVRGFARRALPELPPSDNGGRLESMIGDLLDGAAVNRAVTGCEVVFHCGAVIPGRGTAEHTRAVNVTGTANVIDACLRHRVRRLVHLSTWAIYGDGPTVEANEETPPGSEFFIEGAYPESKLEAERLVHRAGHQHGLETVILRPCIIYGPGLAHAIELFAAWSRSRVKFLLGGGRSRLSFVYVDDVVAALLLAASVPQAGGQSFNISDGRLYTKREILECVGSVCGRPRRLVSVPAAAATMAFALTHAITGLVAPRRAAAFDVRRVLFAVQDHTISCRKAIDVLGYRPKVLLREGVGQTLGWLAQQNDTPRR